MNLGAYAWQLDRQRLIDSGVPAVRQKLPLAGGGLNDATAPQDFERVALAAIPWYALLYFVVWLAAVHFWEEQSLAAHQRFYGLWITGWLLVLFNPVPGYMANLLSRPIPKPSRRRQSFAVYSVPVIVAVPLLALGIVSMEREIREGVL